MHYPAIASMLSGTYMVDGEHCVAVKPRATMEFVKKLHKQMFPDFYDEKKKKELRQKFEPKIVTIKSDTSGKLYNIHVWPDGRRECDCPGFTYRRKCRHTSLVKG